MLRAGSTKEPLFSPELWRVVEETWRITEVRTEASHVQKLRAAAFVHGVHNIPLLVILAWDGACHTRVGT